MQSGVGGRNPAGTPTGRSPSTSSASPASSSSTSIHQQQQQQQQQQHHQQLQQQQLQLQQQQQQFAFRQPFQQQQLRKPEEEGIVSYPGGSHGVAARGNFQMSPSNFQRKFSDLQQPYIVSQGQEDNQFKVQGLNQHAQNQMYQPYAQFANFQAAQQKSFGNMQPHHQARMPNVSLPGRDQELRMGNVKMQELMSFQAANQSQPSMSKKPEQASPAEKPSGFMGADQKGDSKPPQSVSGFMSTANASGHPQVPQPMSNLANVTSNQFAIAQFQAMHAWALEKKIDLSHPSSTALIAQFINTWQSRMLGAQRQQEKHAAAPIPHAQLLKQSISSPVGSESSAHGSSMGDASVQAGPPKSQQTTLSVPNSTTGTSNVIGNNSNQVQQVSVLNKEMKNEIKVQKQPGAAGNGLPAMHAREHINSTSQNLANSSQKAPLTDPKLVQMQYLRSQQLHRPPQPGVSSSTEGSGNQNPSQNAAVHVPPQRFGFTKQQLHVLKAQILAFRRIKRGEAALPEELLNAIVPPPLDAQSQQAPAVVESTNHDRNAGMNLEEHARVVPTNATSSSQPAPLNKVQVPPKEEQPSAEEKVTTVNHIAGPTSLETEPPKVESSAKVEQSSNGPVKTEKEPENPVQQMSNRGESATEKGKILSNNDSAADMAQGKKHPQPNSAPPKDVNATRKYHGPLFDFPCFTRKHDSFSSTTSTSNGSNLFLSYDVKDLLYEEGIEFISKRRQGNLKKINFLLSMKPDSKRIRPDLILRLQIEERKLQLVDLQARLRDEVDLQQKEIMSMPDRPYRKFVRQCERQRIDLLRQVQLSQKVIREKQLKSIFQWRKKLLEAHWSIRDARTTRNRGVAKYHEKMLREFSKRKDDDRNKRMEALKNNDVDRYREMLLEQQTNIPGDAAQRYTVLSSFLSQTEEYLHRLGGKITAAKNQQEVEEAARAAAVAARLQGLSEEEVKAAAACAGEEVMIRNRFSEMNAPNDHSSVNKYYNLAHAVNEKVARQPSLLRAGTLRDYQLIGLQWMLSLYNNKLNGILADEMGLGKTVQVMALIAYLMEFKGNYGPHLIIVPNAVLVNWKSELYTWLPSASCIFYVGSKEQRSKLFTQEVCAMKFNVLVTTYEFVMYDRSKLSKVDWKYIIIDEAQRMKDRESVLARDLDRYRCQRRLLLTGTPLQNDLKELWSLLNLLLPEVFDNRKAFHDWFSKPFQKDAPPQGAEEEDDWLETEKKVIIIHRLHQILEPFMLRRRVEDVEGSLPPKVPIVLRCRMSAMQGAIYDWIKSTGTLRVDPEDELRRAQKNSLYQTKMYKNLNNKCMELRKACNHPLLNYPYFNDYSKDFLVRSCGKFWMLDRILIKLQRTGHRVLLFSTMTKLLDLLEEYLQWRRLAYRRIDGTTSLEDRESAIVDFNSSDSECFIFLLSIRAAGRGLNLQSADTVVIYDPDPNPQNEEQAVARAHRIGQKREVKVIYMEAVVDKISSYQKEDELRNGGSVDSEDDLAGKDRYMGSIESLIRNNIQQYKIDMADEVINAGRFDQRTTHEERRMTLETLLHDEERYQENVHDVPSLQEVNRMIARSEEEIELFDQMDEEFEWVGDMMKYNQVPKWLRAGSREVNAIIASLSKKPSKNFLSSAVDEPSEMLSEVSHNRSERRKGRAKGSTDKYSVYQELDDEDVEESDASSEDRNTYSLHEEEEGEIGEDEDEEFHGMTGPPLNDKFQSEEEGLICDGDTFDFPQGMEVSKSDRAFEEARSSGSSSGSRRLIQFPAASTSQKFGSLSALEAKPGSSASPMVQNEELEEGEIAVSGDSQMDLQKSGSWTHEYDEGEDGQVMQRKTKGKRSVRVRSRYMVDRLEEKTNSERFSHCSPKPHLHVELQTKEFSEPSSNKQEASNLPLKQKRNLPPRKLSGTVTQHGMPKTTITNCFSGSTEGGNDHPRESWNGKAVSISGSSSLPAKMPEIVQRKCKNVINKLQRRIDKDGHQIIPILFDLLRSSSMSLSGNLLDLRKIDQHVESFEYASVNDFISDIQLMLRSLVQYCNSSYEVKSEARKVQDLFFDIMKIAFPDSDLREAKTSLTLPGAVKGTQLSSPKEGVAQSKRHKLLHDVEQNPRNPKNVPRTPLSVENQRTVENQRGRESGSKPHKEIRPPFPSGQSQPESSQFPHPIDMVICKKKRNDREKSAIMQRIGPLSPSSSGRTGPASPFSPGRLGPVSPPSFGRAGPISPLNPSRAGPVSPPSQSRTNRGPVHKEGGSGQQQHMSIPAGNTQRQVQQQSDALGVGSAGIEAQWAKPVKRMRTDTGKRRPSHF